MSRSQSYFIDVTNLEANKGAVVAFLAKRYALAPEEIATVGDMHNDVSMFKASGLSVAMGNASTEVRAAATYVTRTNADEGFAHAMSDYVLDAARR